MKWNHVVLYITAFLVGPGIKQVHMVFFLKLFYGNREVNEYHNIMYQLKDYFLIFLFSD